MGTIVLSDRDDTERVGIRWFIEAYHLPFQDIKIADTTEQLLSVINNHQPDVVYMELEMIPSHLFQKVVDAIQSYDCHVICTTTEPVFERAIQAIELQAKSLLVKPFSPDKLKKSPFTSCPKTASASEGRGARPKLGAANLY
ncbi:MAG: response regulator [Bacillus sp. (in: Bacteria)]|nr:response regulator [Bacillus sp. (in: firmicutes)]